MKPKTRLKKQMTKREKLAYVRSEAPFTTVSYVLAVNSVEVTQTELDTILEDTPIARMNIEGISFHDSDARTIDRKTNYLISWDGDYE